MGGSSGMLSLATFEKRLLIVSREKPFGAKNDICKLKKGRWLRIIARKGRKQTSRHLVGHGCIDRKPKWRKS